MVEYAPQGVFGILTLHGHFNRFTNGDAETPRAIGICGQDRTTGGGLRAGASNHPCAVGLHQGTAVGLLVVAHLHHIDEDLKAEEGAGERERRTPLASTSFGDNTLHTLLLVVVSLRNSGIWLVATSWANTLILVVDLGRGIEGPFEATRPVER